MKKLFFSTISFAISLFVTAQSDSTAYRYILGTNFDFIDGLDAKGLSHHVNISLPSAFSSRKGFIAGIYQNRQTSLRDTLQILNRGNNMRQYVAYPASDPSAVKIVRVDSVRLEKITMTKSLGLYFQPVFRLTGADDSETKIYAVGHLEYVRRNFEEKNTISYKPTDTLLINKTDLVRYPPIPGSQTIKYRKDEGYFGVGLMVYHKNRFVELQIKGMMGGANLDNWLCWYGVDISLMEVKSKFELGISYKGILPDHPPYYLNVFLSKVFYLDKIGDLLK